ncbi:MAG: sigma-70 family RNA polymerase sigma factor [Crocinitomicaceae bacterium]
MKEIVHMHRDLIEAAKKGERYAQKSLFDLYSKAMYNIGMRILGNPDDAADVTQDVFLEIFKKLDSFSYKSTFGAWAKKIMVNRSINHLQRRPMHYDLPETEALHEDQNNENEDVAALMMQLNTSLLELPEGCRVVFTLYYFEGLRHEEIASYLNISASTSKSQLSRAKQLLRTSITQKIEA